MRVLVATTFRSVLGGVETYLRALLPGLRARGHEVAVWHELPAEPGRPVIDADVDGVPVWQGRDCWREAERWRPDVAYAQGVQDPALEEAFLLGSFPTVLFAHNYHGTCVSGTKMHASPCPRPCDRTLGMGCLAAFF